MTGNNPLYINRLIRQLGSTLAMKNLGSLHYFFELEVHRINDKLFLTQTKYAIDLLHKFKMDGAKPYSSPVMFVSKLSTFDGDPLPNLSDYRSTVRALH